MTVKPITSISQLKLVPKSVSDTRLLEADHRIANSLALVTGLIRLQAKELSARKDGLSGAEAAHLLEETAVRIDAVARWHRLLAQFADSRHVDAADYLRDVCEAAVASLAGPGRVQLETDLENGCLLAIEQVAPLALLTSEALTNAIKYAHPAGVAGKIRVSCARSSLDGRLKLSVVDDGVGLPDGFDPLSDGGLGFRVMRSLARQLDAALTFRSTDLGLHMEISVPPAVVNEG